MPKLVKLHRFNEIFVDLSPSFCDFLFFIKISAVAAGSALKFNSFFRIIMKTAFLFPGQGSQFIGMGKDLADAIPEVANIFEKANSIVGYDLKSICFDGPAEKLNSTTISQPVIFTVSAALLDCIRTKTNLLPDITAGLSLGEYTALYAAGVISFEDSLKLVQKRGQAMQAAADSTQGSMVSIIGLEEER
jgi:[acyl-carrier-protein] S-malonyltransferase